MNFLKVNDQACRHDGICVETCPVQILQMDKATNLPVVVEGGRERCINCGHCVAVCPHGAISLEKMPVTDCAPLPEGWNLSPEKISRFLKGRRSIRVFKKDLVERAVIEQLIDTARYAPSGINLQPISWKVVYEPQKVRELAGLTVSWIKTLVQQQAPMAQAFRLDRLTAEWEAGKDLICRQAPHVVAAYGLRDDPTAPSAGTIALTYLELAAASHGLGACWAGYVHMAANSDLLVKKILGLRSRETCLGAMLIGYPKYKYSRIPLRNPAKIFWR